MTRSPASTLLCALALIPAALIAGRQNPPSQTIPALAHVSKPLIGAVFESKDVDVQPQALSYPRPNYPVGLRRAGVSGKVDVRFVVDAQGVPRDVEILSATHKEFGPAAIEAIEKRRYQPALKDGQPVNCRLQFPFAFTLRDKTR